VIAPVVDFGWLADHRDEVVLADVRYYLDGRSGRAAYDAGHLPGAVHVELDEWLASPATPQDGRHPLPSPETFATGMSRLGIGDASTVVAYDDAGGTIAARLVWMLRALGRDAALLDGGLLAYDGRLETEAPEPAGEADFTPTPWPADRLASADDAADPANVVVDARQRERFRGDTEPVDPRAGHIPGARSLPCREHVDERGRLLGAELLRRNLGAAGIEEGTPVVSYCGSGVTACHNLLVIEHAGLGHGRLYPGSWSQWSHSSRPAATGDESGAPGRSQ
jgi:thiosulfate/3-mercaptopyruvate sulfurtransferase